MPNGEHGEKIAVHDSEINAIQDQLKKNESLHYSAMDKSSKAHALLIDKVHCVDTKVERARTTIKVWGSVLAFSIAVAGIIVPVLLAVASNN